MAEKTTSLIEVPCTIGAFAAHPTGNEQGSWRYLNIKTGKPLIRKKGTTLPVPLDIPARIHALADHNSSTEEFVILDNHDNPFISYNNNDLNDASSIDTKMVGVETVEEEDTIVKKSESGEIENKSENENLSEESKNAGVNVRHCVNKECSLRTDATKTSKVISTCAIGVVASLWASHISGL